MFKLIIAAILTVFYVGISRPITVDNVGQIRVIHEVYDAPINTMAQETTYLAFDTHSKLLGIVNAAAPWVDGNIYFFDLTTFQSVELINDVELVGTSLYFTNEWLLVGRQFGDLERYDLVTEKLLCTTPIGVNGDIEDISTSANHEYIAVVATTELRGEYIFYLAKFDQEPLIRIPTGQLGRGYSTELHPSDNIVAVAITQMYREDFGIPRLPGQNVITGVQIWNADTAELISFCDKYRWGLAYTNTLVFTPDGHKIIYMAEDGIRIWDMRDCREFDEPWVILEAPSETEYLMTFAMHPTEPILVTAYRSSEKGRGILRFWDVDTLELLAEITDYGEGEYNAITNLAFSPDGTLIASGGQDGMVRLWGIPSGE